MALIGKAAFGGDGCQRPFEITQQFAGGSNLQLLFVLSRSTSLDLAEDTRQVNRMNSSFASEISHAKWLTKSCVQPLFYPAKPARDRFFGAAEFRDRREHFERAGFQHERFRMCFECGRLKRRRLKCRKEAQAGPEHSTSATIDANPFRQAQVERVQGLAAEFDGEE